MRVSKQKRCHTRVMKQKLGGLNLLEAYCTQVYEIAYRKHAEDRMLIRRTNQSCMGCDAIRHQGGEFEMKIQHAHGAVSLSLEFR